MLLGIRPRYSDATNMGGSSFVSHLFHAAAAVEVGLCEVALIAYGSTQRSASGRLVSGSESLTYEAPYRPRYPVSAYALVASRHMHEYGTTREQLAEVAVAAREWAKLNPKAFVRDDLSVEYVLRSRMVSSPPKRPGLLPGDRRRRGRAHHKRREGPEPPQAPGLPAWSRGGALAPQHLTDARPDHERRRRIRAAGLPDGESRA